MSPSQSRVLAVAHNYPPHLGGLEVVAQSVASGMARRGYAVSVLTSSAAGLRGLCLEDGVRVRRVPASHWLERYGVPFPLFSPSLLWHAWRMTRRADVVQIHDMLYLTSWLFALACVLQRKPYVVTQHVGFVEHPSRIVRAVQHRVHATIGRFVMGNAQVILPINELIAAGTREQFPQARYEILPNGVDTVRFRPATPAERLEIRERFGLPAEEVLVLYAGRFVPKKGFDVVSASGGEGYRLVFAGGDRPEDRPELADHIFLGALAAEDMAAVFRAVDLFVVASVWETPLTVLEAMNSGTAVLLNEDPVLRLLAPPDAGEEFLAITVDSLSRRLAELAKDPAELRVRGAQARATAEAKLSWDAYLDRFTAVIDPLVELGKDEGAAATDPHSLVQTLARQVLGA
jgi:D-inositol-3-phosphate glycosyltransferase